MRRLALCSLLLWSMMNTAPASAHEVHHTIESSGAVVVQLKYADGSPFAYEAFEASPEGAATPSQVGRTDAQGRAVFIPGETKRWKLKAYTADGHGVSLNFEAPTVASSSATGGETPARASLLLFGLSLLFGGFGLYQLCLRKNKA